MQWSQASGKQFARCRMCVCALESRVLSFFQAGEEATEGEKSKDKRKINDCWMREKNGKTGKWWEIRIGGRRREGGKHLNKKWTLKFEKKETYLLPPTKQRTVKNEIRLAVIKGELTHADNKKKFKKSKSKDQDGLVAKLQIQTRDVCCLLLFPFVCKRCVWQ